MIGPGDTFPSLPVWYADAAETVRLDVAGLLAKGLNILFAVPGAYTPTCHNHHLPGFVHMAGRLRECGVSRIICASVNDHHVMRAWAKDQHALGTIGFIADFDAALARALGLERDLDAVGLGTRFVRSAMLVRDGVVQNLLLDGEPGKLARTSAANILDVVQAQCTSDNSEVEEPVG